MTDVYHGRIHVAGKYTCVSTLVVVSNTQLALTHQHQENGRISLIGFPASALVATRVY